MVNNTIIGILSLLNTFHLPYGNDRRNDVDGLMNLIKKILSSYLSGRVAVNLSAPSYPVRGVCFRYSKSVDPRLLYVSKGVY
jgi:hypothetical protein